MKKSSRKQCISKCLFLNVLYLTANIDFVASSERPYLHLETLTMCSFKFPRLLYSGDTSLVVPCWQVLQLFLFRLSRLQGLTVD